MRTTDVFTVRVERLSGETALVRLDIGNLTFGIGRPRNGLEAASVARTLRDALTGLLPGWLPIESCPEDENVLVATTGGWVDTAFWTNDGDGPKWWWLVSANKYAKHPLHPNLVPTHWMPLPRHPEHAKSAHPIEAPDEPPPADHIAAMTHRVQEDKA